MTFGEKLYQLRTERKMSQEGLARKLGVSRQAISRWELGEVVPDTVNVLAVSRLFDVSTDYLLQEDCLSDSDIPTEEDVEENLKDRQYQVGSGIGYRFLTLAGPAIWHKNAGAEATLLLLFTLGWTLLFAFYWLIPCIECVSAIKRQQARCCAVIFFLLVSFAFCHRS